MHVAVETFAVGPAGHSVAVGQLFVDPQVIGQLVIVAVSVLERDDVDRTLNSFQDLVPLLLVLNDADGVLLVQLLARHCRFDAVDVRRNHRRQIAGELLHIPSHPGVQLGDSGEGAADFKVQIPAAEGFALPVAAPDLVGDRAADLHFAFAFVVVPVFAGVVQPEIELHCVFFSEVEEEVHQVRRRPVAPFAFHQVRGRIGDEAAVAAPDQDHGVDSDRFH